MSFSLRDYQEKDVAIIRETFRAVRSQLYVLPTGGGKTRVFSYITQSAASKGNSVCIVVHRQELVVQSSLSLAELGLKHRVITSSAVTKQCLQAHLEDYGQSFIHQQSPIMIASVQTLVRQPELLKSVRLLIIDEAHHTVAGSWDKCFKAAEIAKILGVTATPQRPDGNGLGNHYDEINVGVSMAELINRGFLCTPKVYGPSKAPDLSEAKTKFGDYVIGDIDAIMDKPMIIGDAVAHYRELCDKVPAIAYCVSVKHAEHVAEQFKAAGYKAICIDGKTDKTVRRNAIKALGRGEIHVITSCDIISEGTDIPLVGCGIMLRPTKSLVLFLQQAGRILRPYPHNELMKLPHMQKLIGPDGKHQAFLLDHVGNTMIHGLPQMDREWYLEGGRSKKEKNEIPIRQCPKCFFVHEPADFCPCCGFSYLADVKPAELPKVGEGKLQEITAEWFRSGGKDIVTAPLNEVLASADTMEQLEEIRKARGYKKNWTYYVMQSRQKKAGNKP